MQQADAFGKELKVERARHAEAAAVLREEIQESQKGLKASGEELAACRVRRAIASKVYEASQKALGEEKGLLLEPQETLEAQIRSRGKELEKLYAEHAAARASWEAK